MARRHPGRAAGDARRVRRGGRRPARLRDHRAAAGRRDRSSCWSSKTLADRRQGHPAEAGQGGRRRGPKPGDGGDRAGDGARRHRRAACGRGMSRGIGGRATIPAGGVVAFGQSLAAQLGPVFCIPANRELRRLLGPRRGPPRSRSATARTSPGRAASWLPSHRRSTHACWCVPGPPGSRSRTRWRATSGDLPPVPVQLPDRAGQGARRDCPELRRGAAGVRSSARTSRSSPACARSSSRTCWRWRPASRAGRDRRGSGRRGDGRAPAARRRVPSRLLPGPGRPSDSTPPRPSNSRCETSPPTFRPAQASWTWCPASPTSSRSSAPRRRLKFGGLERRQQRYLLVGGPAGREPGVAEAIGAAAGLRAGFERRVEGWEHQVELARHDLAVLDKQLEAARVRERMRNAPRRRSTCARSSRRRRCSSCSARKFSSLGLYTYLARSLQRLLPRGLQRRLRDGAAGRAGLPAGAQRRRDRAAQPLATGTRRMPGCWPASGCWSTSRPWSAGSWRPTTAG